MAISPTVRPSAVDETARTGISAPAARETRGGTILNKITIDRATVEQALETLLDCEDQLVKPYNRKAYYAAEALHSALEQPNEFHPDWDQIKPFNDRIAELETAAKQALEALKGVIHAHGYNGGTPVEAITALRQSLEQGGTLINDGTKGPQQEQTDWEAVAADQAMTIAMLKTEVQEIANKQEPVAWLVYTLDGGSVFVTDNPSDFTDEHRALPLYTSPPAQQEPVAPAVIAGALFDFIGWLTSRQQRVTWSACDDATTAIDAVIEFAKMRGLSLDEVHVLDWQDRIQDGEVFPWPVIDKSAAIRIATALGWEPKREWVGLTDEEREFIYHNREPYADLKAVEALLKEKNNG